MMTLALRENVLGVSLRARLLMTIRVCRLPIVVKLLLSLLRARSTVTPATPVGRCDRLKLTWRSIVLPRSIGVTKSVVFEVRLGVPKNITLSLLIIPLALAMRNVARPMLRPLLVVRSIMIRFPGTSRAAPLLGPRDRAIESCSPYGATVVYGRRVVFLPYLGSV